MRPLLLLIVPALFAFLVPQAAVREPGSKVRVVTRNLEPFSFEKDGRRAGYAAELWEQLAREAKLDYDMQVAGTAQEIIGVLKFSGSFADNIFSLVKNLFNLELIGAFLLLMATMLIISHLVWRYEHKVNEDMWPKDYKNGMWESFWWTISTLLIGGADNKGPGDLPGRHVATVKGSTTETWLTAKGAKVVPLASVTDCIVALKSGDVQAVVYDAPVLQYEAARLNDEKLQMAGPVFERQNYAFALQPDSTLREKLNQALLKLSEQGVGGELRKKCFGMDQLPRMESPNHA